MSKLKVTKTATIFFAGFTLIPRSFLLFKISQAPVSCVRLVPEPTSNCKFTEAGNACLYHSLCHIILFER